jgi:hypothetical protein
LHLSSLTKKKKKKKNKTKKKKKKKQQATTATSEARSFSSVFSIHFSSLSLLFISAKSISQPFNIKI